MWLDVKEVGIAVDGSLMDSAAISLFKGVEDAGKRREACSGTIIHEEFRLHWWN